MRHASLPVSIGGLFAALVFVAPAFAADDPKGFRALTIDASKDIGQIRSLQGVNGPPSPIMAGLPNLIEQYRELRVDQVRTHDFMGPTEIDSHYDYHDGNLSSLIPDPAQRAGVVRAGNASIIFPDWNADPEDPESYHFAATDKAIASIIASGAEVYYRIGRSWGARTEPPPDYDKYASVVKHIAMHYNQGWDDGFHDHIRYWEFWNEPEGFWAGTPKQFFSLYEKTARALKSLDATLKVGGNAQATPGGASPWREGFLDYCAAHHVPLDFFSWHTYQRDSADPYDAVRLSQRIRQVLDGHGFPQAESILSEWNLSYDYTINEAAELQGAHNAAFVGAVLTYMQDAPIAHAHFYRGDAAWMGLFDLNGNFYRPAHVFEAMGKMLDSPVRLAVSGTDTYGFAALAGKSKDGSVVQILISNYEKPAGYKPVDMPEAPEFQDPTSPSLWDRFPLEGPMEGRSDISYRDNAGYRLLITALPWGKAFFTIKRYRISARQPFELVESRTAAGDGALRMSVAMPIDSVDLLVFRRN